MNKALHTKPSKPSRGYNIAVLQNSNIKGSVNQDTQPMLRLYFFTIKVIAI